MAECGLAAVQIWLVRTSASSASSTDRCAPPPVHCSTLYVQRFVMWSRRRVLAETELTELPEDARKLALDRFRILRPHLEENQSLQSVAQAAGVPYRTANRWLTEYRHRVGH
jgi:hypothetical protein